MKPPHEMTAAELDAAVCAEIIGYGDRVIPPYREGGRPLIRDNMCNVAVRPYSTDPCAAWEVVRHCDKFWFGISYTEAHDDGMEHERCSISVYPLGSLDSLVSLTRSEMPRAVCEAALLAVRA